MATAHTLKKIIITGANGVGKSHFAQQLAQVCPGVPIVAYDALKLKTGWTQRPRADTEVALAEVIRQPSWILEGGPSLLPVAIAEADGLIWLDPPEYLRAWRLAVRPWKHRGRTRPELPRGNIDWPLQQYAFALHSLWKGARTRVDIRAIYDNACHIRKWHCSQAPDRQRAIAEIAAAQTDRRYSVSSLH